MLSWAEEVTDGGAGSDVAESNSRGDLLELYCGNGNFGLAIAKNFRRCFATELAQDRQMLDGAKLDGA